MEVNFPRKLIKVGPCVAMTRFRSDDPIVTERPIVFYKDDYWVAARLIYCLNVSEIPCHPMPRNSGWVLHTCDCQWCLNLDHLYVGTAKKNTKDIYDRLPSFSQRRWSTNEEEEKFIAGPLPEGWRKGRCLDNSGEKNGFFGKKHSSETIARMKSDVRRKNKPKDHGNNIRKSVMGRRKLIKPDGSWTWHKPA